MAAGATGVQDVVRSVLRCGCRGDQDAGRTPRRASCADVWRSGNDWFNAAYPDPSDTDPTVYDTELNPRATAWFKESATHLLERIPPCLAVLAAHEIECVRVEATDPGRVIYEDDVQVVVVPHDPQRATSYHP